MAFGQSRKAKGEGDSNEKYEKHSDRAEKREHEEATRKRLAREEVVRKWAIQEFGLANLMVKVINVYGNAYRINAYCTIDGEVVTTHRIDSSKFVHYDC